MDKEDPADNLDTSPVEEKTEDINEKEISNPVSEPTVATDAAKKKSFLSKLNPKTLFAGFKGMNRNTRLAVVLTAALLLVGVTAFALTRSEKTQDLADEQTIEEIDQAETINAKITLKEGTLEYHRDGQWSSATTETELTAGESLRTVGATSRAVITFEDGSEARLDANSELEIQGATSSRIVIKHINGYVYNRVNPSETLTYVVMSDDAQYEALGTAFRTATSGDEQSVEVYQSKVIETSTNKTPKEGEKLTVKSEVAPQNDGKVEKLDMEQVKNDAFLQWNRDLDLKNEKYKNSLGVLSDLTPPEITIDTSDGKVILLEPTATEGTIEFSGKTEKGAKVTVQSKSQEGSQPVDAVVDENGGFKTPVMTGPIGSASFEFIAKDRAGNATTKTLRVTFQKKSQPVGSSNIVLSGNADTAENKVKLSWALNGTTTTPDGVKIVWSKTSNPVLDGGSGTGAQYAETGTSASIKFNDIKSTDGSGTYYFKVCIYDKASGTCGLYSNQVTLSIP